jgi:hypothetical protein
MIPLCNVKRRHITTRANDDGSVRHYFRRRGMPMARLPTPDSPLFEEAYSLRLAESEGMTHATDHTRGRARDGYRRHWAGSLLRNAKYRINRECTLTADDLFGMFQDQNDRCALSGLRFRYRRDEGRRDPMSPSLDRIDSRSGYTVANCRLVLLAVNVALNNWGDETFVRICKAVAKRSPSRPLMES